MTDDQFPTRESVPEALLWRLVHRELGPEQEAALEARLETDEALRRRLEALRRLWEELDAGPPPEPPAGFAAAVIAAVGRRREVTWEWSALPAALRAAAVAASLVGLAGGLVVGQAFGPAAEASSDGEVESAWIDDSVSLAEDYWLDVEAVPRGETLDRGEQLR